MSVLDARILLPFLTLYKGSSFWTSARLRALREVWPQQNVTWESCVHSIARDRTGHVGEEAVSHGILTVKESKQVKSEVAKDEFETLR